MSDVLADLYAEWTWRNRFVASVYHGDPLPPAPDSVLPCNLRGHGPERGPHNCHRAECAEQNSAFHRARRIREREAAIERGERIVRLHGAARGPHRCGRAECREQHRAAERDRMRRRRAIGTVERDLAWLRVSGQLPAGPRRAA